METLIVRAKSKDEMNFVQEVLRKMKIDSAVIELDSKIRNKNQFLDSLELRVRNLDKTLKEGKKLKNAFELLDEL